MGLPDLWGDGSGSFDCVVVHFVDDYFALEDNEKTKSKPGRTRSVRPTRASSTLGPFTGLALDEFAEHFFRVDGDEEAAAAGEDLSFFVEDFGFVDVLATLDADFPALDVQRFVERDGPEVFDGHFFR